MKRLQNSTLLALLLAANLIAYTYQIACTANCSSCHITTGVCNPLGCKWGYSRAVNGTCTLISTSAGEGIMQDAQTTTVEYANAEGFNRRNANVSAALASTATTTCSASCSDAGCLTHNAAEYCYGCRSAWPTSPSANLVAGHGQATWILASACTGTTTVVANCSQQVGATYCSLCNNGYISSRNGDTATCEPRYKNQDWLDPSKLLHCLMVDASNNCLTCDIFKNVLQATNTTCTAPTGDNKYIVGRATYVASVTTDVVRWQVSGTTSPFTVTDVMIGMGATKPTSVAAKTYGSGIYVDTTAKHMSHESYHLASSKPWITAVTGETGLIYVYTFGYGMAVPQSFSAYRTPSHVFGSGERIAAATNNCPSTTVTCNGRSTNSNSCIGTGRCSCSATYGGIACEETITKTYTGGFSYDKATAVDGKVIFKTTVGDMKKFGYTDILASIPQNMNKAGGQSIQALVRSASINGRYRKHIYTKSAWTGNTYLPGFQSDYWGGEKTLGKERRILARIFGKNDYKMTFGQDKESFEGMGADTDPIYTTMVNLNEVSMSLGAEVLERGMPLALKIIIPVFCVLTVALAALIVWCLFGGEGEEEDDEGGAAKDAGNEDKANLNADGKEQTYQIPQEKEKSTVKTEKFNNPDSAPVNKQDDLGMTQQGEQKPVQKVEPTPVQKEEPAPAPVQHQEPAPEPVQHEEPAPQQDGGWDEGEDKEKIETQNVQMGQKGSLSGNNLDDPETGKDVIPSNGELQFDPIEGDSIE